MARETRSLSCGVVVGILTAIFVTIVRIDAAADRAATTSSDKGGRTNFELRDSAIKRALLSISTGKLPPTDDRLIGLVADNIRDVAAGSSDPAVGIEAAGRQAQEAVSEVAAAYTAIIFQSTSAKEAQRLFGRYQNTVDRIVEFAKSGSFVGRNRTTSEPTNI